MIKTLKISISFLLLFNSIGALYGGWSLMDYPDGSHIQLSLHWLEHTPFSTYFIPGLVLFVVNGVFGMSVFMFVLLKHKMAANLVVVQGVLLTGWIGIQMLMIQTVYFLHIVMGAVGLALMGLGWLLKKNTR